MFTSKTRPKGAGFCSGSSAPVSERSAPVRALNRKRSLSTLGWPSWQHSRLSAKPVGVRVQYSFLVSCLTAYVRFYPRWRAQERRSPGKVLGVLPPFGRFWGERQLRTARDPKPRPTIAAVLAPVHGRPLRQGSPGRSPQVPTLCLFVSAGTPRSLTQPNSPCRSLSHAPTQDAKLTL